MTPEQEQKLNDIHAALFEAPKGSKDDPLIKDLRDVVQAYKRASWATRALIWAVPTLAMLGASARSILAWFKFGG